MSTPYQLDLLGQPAIGGDVVHRIIYLLEVYPETRDDYKTLIARYWYQFDGLQQILEGTPMSIKDFIHWIRTCATSPKTIQNRAMEIQRQRPELAARPAVQRKRRQQAKAGPVRY